ncbi:MAG: hypothetical protein AB1546_04645 [bacterium]
MDKNARVFEVNDPEMENMVLFRRKRQAVHASREMERQIKEKRKDTEVGIALAHTRRRGFKWCITESNRPIRRI